MVIDKILKQITPERAEKEIKAVKAFEVPADFQKWIKEYEKFGKRNMFTWKLFLKAKRELNYLPVSKTPPRLFEETYFLMAMFVILVDDAVDKKQSGRLPAELFKIVSAEDYIDVNKLNKKEAEYLKFTIKVWRKINQLIKKYPGYKKFKDIFVYDIKQIVNAMEYDLLTNKNRSLINETEFWLHSPQTMQFIITPSIDLMSLSVFNMNELGAVREVVWQALKMLRIGNWVSTWEKEICENDFTSGVFAIALSQKVISANELASKNSFEIINKIKKAKIEKKLLEEWGSCHKNILKYKPKVKAINIDKLLAGLEKLLIFELIGGKKYK